MSLVIIPLLIFSSCSKDVLDEKALDFLTPSNAYTTVIGIRQGITGLHSLARSYWYYGGRQESACIYLGNGTDIAYHGEDPTLSTYLSDYVAGLNAQSPASSTLWNNCYTFIQNTNVIIESVKASDIKIWTSDAQKNAYLGEALFFRAFAYRILVAFYGDVPLVTEVTKSAKTDYVRAPKADVYKQIEEDLVFASANLPARGKEEAPGRITQAAARHILSEIYLTQGKFQLAVDAATQVINGAGYALMTTRFGTKLGKDVFGSGDVFYDLFAGGNQNQTANTEAIWVIQIEPLITGGGSNGCERYFGPAYFRMGNTPDGKKAFIGELVNNVRTGYLDTLGRPTGKIRPTNYAIYDIWRSDWNNDIRNAKHNIKRNFYFNNPASIYDKQKIDFKLYTPGIRDAIKDTCQYIYPWHTKFMSPLEHAANPATSGNGFCEKDIYAIRLAETYLLRAEAYLGLGNKDLAAADINAIRNRAKATPVLPANVTIEYILDERARELYGEEWRHITLRRVGKFVERVKQYNNNPLKPQLNIQNYHVLWPIPQSQIDLNIGAKMTQNTGY